MEQTSAELPTKPRLYQAEVYVQSRKGILNPESKAILGGIHTLGHANVQTLNAGKRFTLKVEATNLVEAEKQLRTLAETVLSNPVIEDYELRIKR